MIVAVVPTKPFAAAKSRLAVALDPTTRERLARGLFRHTLDTLWRAPSVDRVVVVGEVAPPPPAIGIADPGDGLNAAVAAGVSACGAADAVLVLPADLPLLNASAVERLTARLQRGGEPLLVIAPDRRRDGTNALLTSPPRLVEPAFGPGSFARHREAALTIGALVSLDDDPALALDLDLPEDLAVIPKAVLHHLLELGALERPPTFTRR